jgi:hypothetical protein
MMFIVQTTNCSITYDRHLRSYVYRRGHNLGVTNRLLNHEIALIRNIKYTENSIIYKLLKSLKFLEYYRHVLFHFFSSSVKAEKIKLECFPSIGILG